MPANRKQILFNSGTPEYAWLSNFSPHPVRTRHGLFPTAEHAYQAEKAVHHEDAALVGKILQERHPQNAKRLAYVIDVRRDWHDVKRTVMKQVMRLKFGQNLELSEMLLDTGDAELIHYAPWGDTYWGVDGAMEGDNWQGRLLEEIRDEIRNGRKAF